MDNIKWLKRKYPESYEEIFPFIDYYDLKKLKVGRLLQDISPVHCDEVYSKSTLILFRRSNPLDYNHPVFYIVAKCDPGVTYSGFHSFLECSSYVEEITK